MRPWLFLGALALALLASGGASAQQVSCSVLPNPVYLQVGDTQEPLMKALGRKLRDESERPLTLVYVTSGSCTNVEAIYTGVPIATSALYVPSTAENAAWTPSMPSLPCTMDAPHQVDVANSALFVSSCNARPPPAGIGLFQGPVQGYGFVVPVRSTQRAITAEEAYFAFGFGAAGKAEPWTDESQLYIRTVTKSTLLTLAATVQVPAQKFRGQRLDKSSEVVSALLASPTPERAIGLLGVELFDRSRDKLTLLAFRAFGQRYAFFPDSSASSFDKRNLRDGHYAAWSPTVWLTKVDAAGKPVNADAGYLIDLILGNAVARKPAFESLDVVIDVGLVPDCAMRVTRAFEGGELAPYQPPAPCGCYYDRKVEAKAPSCPTCDPAHPCASGTCRHGFCEAR